MAPRSALMHIRCALRPQDLRVCFDALWESDRLPRRSRGHDRGADRAAVGQYNIKMRKQRQCRITTLPTSQSQRAQASLHWQLCGSPAFLHKAISTDDLMASAEKVAPPDGGMRYSTAGAALDERFYQLDDIETTFVSDLTGISDPAELKKHILQVQHEVYAVSTLNYNSMLQDSGSHARKTND